MKNLGSIPRRRFLGQSAALGALASLESLMPAYALDTTGLPRASQPQGGLSPIELSIQNRTIQIDGRDTASVTVNGTVPGPLVRLQEGEDATLRVTTIAWRKTRRSTGTALSCPQRWMVCPV